MCKKRQDWKPWKETKIIKMNYTEILKLRNTITEINNLMDEFNYHGDLEENFSILEK